MRICPMYKEGDILIHTRHGTDHSYEDVYYIKAVFSTSVTLARKIPKGERALIERHRLDEDLASDYPQFRIVKEKKPFSMEEELFEI
jgi:hypothetical protein